MERVWAGIPFGDGKGKTMSEVRFEPTPPLGDQNTHRETIPWVWRLRPLGHSDTPRDLTRSLLLVLGLLRRGGRRIFPGQTVAETWGPLGSLHQEQGSSSQGERAPGGSTPLISSSVYHHPGPQAAGTPWAMGEQWGRTSFGGPAGLRPVARRTSLHRQRPTRPRHRRKARQNSLQEPTVLQNRLT